MLCHINHQKNSFPQQKLGMECHRKDLPETGQLGSHEPRGAGTDMARDALQAGMRRPLIGRKLRLHDGMAHLTAELPRLHIRDTLKGGGRDNEQIYDGEERHDAELAPYTWHAEIELWIVQRFVTLLSPAHRGPGIANGDQ